MKTDLAPMVRITDVITGISAILRVRGVKTISAENERWAYAFESLNTSVLTESSKRKLRTNFMVQRDKLHGDSLEMGSALYGAIQRGILTLDHPRPVYRMNWSENEAEAALSNLPGDRAMYESLTTKFLDKFESQIS